MRAMALALLSLAACGDDPQADETPDAAALSDAASSAPAADAALAIALGDATPCDPMTEDCSPYDPSDPYDDY